MNNFYPKANFKPVTKKMFENPNYEKDYEFFNDLENNCQVYDFAISKLENLKFN